LRAGLPYLSGVVNSTANQCSNPLPILVPLVIKPSGKIKPGRAALKIQLRTIDNIAETDALKIQCKPSTCGNHLIEVDHKNCDEGNRANGDGCDKGPQPDPPTPTPTATAPGSPVPTSTKTDTPTRTPTKTLTAPPSQSPTK